MNNFKISEIGNHFKIEECLKIDKSRIKILTNFRKNFIN